MSNIDLTKELQTPLHAAIIRGNHQMVSLLIESGANIDAQDYMYKTPLLHAVLKKNTSGVKVLLHYNCDVNLTGWIFPKTLA
jgi:E3 ubiquitin-protein ligase XBAT32/33